MNLLKKSLIYVRLKLIYNKQILNNIYMYVSTLYIVEDALKASLVSYADSMIMLHNRRDQVQDIRTYSRGLLYIMQLTSCVMNAYTEAFVKISK